MKTLKLLVVSADKQDRGSISDVLKLVGNNVFGARNINQAEAFICEHGDTIDAVIIDMDTVPLDIEKCQQLVPQACFIMRSWAFEQMLMPDVVVGSALVSKRIETARIEEYLHALVHQNQRLLAA